MDQQTSRVVATVSVVVPRVLFPSFKHVARGRRAPTEVRRARF